MWTQVPNVSEIETFKETYNDLFAASSARRRQRQVESGLVDKCWTPAKTPNIPRPKGKPRTDAEFATQMAVYAAVVTRLDNAVGKFVEWLRKEGELDNTLLLFLSDNGASAEGGAQGMMKVRPRSRHLSAHVHSCVVSLPRMLVLVRQPGRCDLESCAARAVSDTCDVDGLARQLRFIGGSRRITRGPAPPAQRCQAAEDCG